MEKLIEQIKLAKDILLKGGVVAFPTETVMGLGVVYNDFNAYLRLNIIKRRREDKPYTLMVKNIDEIDKYAMVNDKALKVIKAFMPGSITILLPSKDNVPTYVTHNTGVIGVRVPTNKEAIELLNTVDVPLLVPSANKAGEKPALNNEEVKSIFNDEIDLIIQGSSKGELPSTIIDLSHDDIRLLREGPISFIDIKKVYEEND